MTVTKGELVNSAYEELRISGVTVDPTPEEVVLGIKQMDRMVAQWRQKHLCLGYNDSTAADGIEPDQISGLSLEEENAVILNLSNRLCPAFGKQPNMQTKADAKEAYDNLFSVELTEREQTPYLPLGSGSNYWYSFGYDPNFFMYQLYEENAPSNCDTVDIKIGETGWYNFDFTDYITQIDGQVIQSIEVEDGQGVAVLSSSFTDYTVKLQAEGKIDGLSPVLVTLTTTGPEVRVNPVTINFNVTKT